MKKFLAILILFGLFLPVVIAAMSISTPVPHRPGIEKLPRVELMSALERIASLLFTILLVISLIFLVYAGFLFVTAAGKTEQVEQARHIILYAVIGIIVAILAWGIREFIRGFLIPGMVI